MLGPGIFRARRSPVKAKDAAREIRDFYTLGTDSLWVTFVDGHLWWVFAESEVIWLGVEESGQGTGETAFVQVKSKAGQAVLDDYIRRFRRGRIYDRMFFICHSPTGTLSLDDTAAVHIWTGDRLADASVKAGLFDWLTERSA